ncbi:MAG: hypothetical protein Q4A32_07825 [Lachnospiraceae bacterium]|nr:hypothetical protein [Lachnospiraceae bacterium]
MSTESETTGKKREYSFEYENLAFPMLHTGKAKKKKEEEQEEEIDYDTAIPEVHVKEMHHVKH